MSWAFGLYGLYRRRQSTRMPPGYERIIEIEVESALQDPLFKPFLVVSGKNGGVSSIEEFMNLPPEQQEFYLRVFKHWRQKMRSKGLDRTLIRMFS